MASLFFSRGGSPGPGFAGLTEPGPGFVAPGGGEAGELAVPPPATWKTLAHFGHLTPLPAGGAAGSRRRVLQPGHFTWMAGIVAPGVVLAAQEGKGIITRAEERIQSP